MPITPEDIHIWKVRTIEAVERESKVKEFCKIDPHPKQKLFLELDDVKEALFGGATGGGKTIALLADALKYVHVPDYSALLLRTSYPDLKQEGGLIDVAHGWLQNTSARWNEQDKTWTFPSGATLRFGYLETENDKYRYQGGEYQYIGFDEVTQFRESQYKYLFSRLRKKQSLDVPLRIRGATNPGGIGGAWVFERFIPEDFSPLQARDLKVWYKEHEDGHVSAFVPSLLDDNPSLDRQSYLESLSQLDEITRQQYLSGDWLIQIRGDILHTYSEAHSVITWEQFAEVFGEPKIPNHWMVSIYQDFGTTKDHPCITSWFTTAGQNAPTINGVSLAGRVFLYRGMLRDSEVTAYKIGQEIRGIMAANGEISRCERWQMSHEASSERMEYNNQGLQFSNWPATSKTRGIEQLKNAFDLTDQDKPHPFKPTLKGTPRLFLIVDSKELLNPKTDAGLARWRAEFPAYHWDTLKTGDVMTKLVPYPLFNDAIDTCRAAAADYFPVMTEKSRDEVAQEKYQATTVYARPEYQDDHSIGAQMSRSMAQAKVLKHLKDEGYDEDYEYSGIDLTGGY